VCVVCVRMCVLSVCLHVYVCMCVICLCVCLCAYVSVCVCHVCVCLCVTGSWKPNSNHTPWQGTHFITTQYTNSLCASHCQRSTVLLRLVSYIRPVSDAQNNKVHWSWNSLVCLGLASVVSHRFGYILCYLEFKSSSWDRLLCRIYFGSLANYKNSSN